MGRKSVMCMSVKFCFVLFCLFMCIVVVVVTSCSKLATGVYKTTGIYEQLKSTLKFVKVIY